MKQHSKFFSTLKLFTSFCLTMITTTLIAQDRNIFSSGIKNKRAFKTEVRKMMAEVEIQGVSIAIIKGNKIVFSKGYGHKQKDSSAKVNDKTLFEAASLSKSFMVFVAHKLVDDGKLDLDKPMYKYLDPGPLLNYDQRYKLITPRMILSHSSGLENWRGENDKSKLEIVSDPGKKFVYSGEGYTYLAAVFEKLLEKSYKQFIDELVIDPLSLRRTYTEFSKGGKRPGNYAIGHNQFGRKIKKWKNLNSVPAGGIHITAQDYAKLIIATFDKKHLSESRVNDLLTPIIALDSNFHYFGPGFEILYNGRDTIISHGGSNPGFKGLVFYSTASKNGFVFLTNGDRGKWMAKRMCEMTSDLDINMIFKNIYFEQYPSNAISLLKLYNAGKADQMFKRINELKDDGQLGVQTLNELGNILTASDPVTAHKLLTDNMALYPDSPQAYYLLGKLNMTKKQFASALTHFERAKVLHCQELDLDDELKKCQNFLNKEH